MSIRYVRISRKPWPKLCRSCDENTRDHPTGTPRPVDTQRAYAPLTRWARRVRGAKRATKKTRNWIRVTPVSSVQIQVVSNTFYSEQLGYEAAVVRNQWRIRWTPSNATAWAANGWVSVGKVAGVCFFFNVPP